MDPTNCCEELNFYPTPAPTVNAQPSSVSFTTQTFPWRPDMEVTRVRPSFFSPDSKRMPSKIRNAWTVACQGAAHLANPCFLLQPQYIHRFFRLLQSPRGFAGFIQRRRFLLGVQFLPANILFRTGHPKICVQQTQKTPCYVAGTKSLLALQL